MKATMTTKEVKAYWRKRSPVELRRQALHQRIHSPRFRRMVPVVGVDENGESLYRKSAVVAYTKFAERSYWMIGVKHGPQNGM